ncbi:MAG: hypothetical protein V1749_09360 [Candidatus Desantisbacteria bacterium]
MIKVDKVRCDIRKQLVYEFAYSTKYPTTNVSSQFVIPCFYNDNDNATEDDKVGNIKNPTDLTPEMQKANINVFLLNFNLVQKCYLEA